jgi:hypothetical protein
MKTKEQDMHAVRDLCHGDNCQIAWSEEGGGDVYRLEEMLFLFSIPQYGGKSRYENCFHRDDAEKLVALARSWT